jgi:transposase
MTVSAAAGPGATASQREATAVRQVRESAQALVAQNRVGEAVELFDSALAALLRRNQELELLVRKLQRERVGTRSERIDPAQLRLLLDQVGSMADVVPIPDPVAEAREDEELRRETEEAKKGEAEKKQGRRARRNRRLGVASGVEVIVHRHELPEAERQCCGETKGPIGEDVTHRLEFVPGHFIDHQHHQVNYACAKCRDGVQAAAAPVQVIPRSPAGPSVLAHVVVSKFVDHMPLHRLHNSYARSGWTIPVSTLSDWCWDVADILTPVVDRLEERLLAAYVVRLDGTGLKVLDRGSPLNVTKGVIWGYVGDDRDVVFRYAPTGSGEDGPWDFLRNRKGYVQADGAGVFDRLYNGVVASAIEIGCWAHGRRRLVALKDTDCRVAYPLQLIARLYGIERLADARGLLPEARAALRQERSVPVLEKIKRWIVPTLEKEPPSSDLAKAAAYLVNQWGALTRFPEDGRLDLDNNLCERQLRAIALGRRNYLFCGSHDAARRAAVLYSLTRTCALHGIPPLAYLTDVMHKLADGWRQSRIAELLPGNWMPS